MTALVRPASLDDLDAIWPLAREFATSFSPERAPFEDSFERLLADPHALLLVAEVEGDVVGYLLAHRHDTFLANGPVAWIEEVMVDAARRSGGIGRALMSGAESWSAADGCAYVSLASRRAGGFYRALGYDHSAEFFTKTLPRRS